MIALHEAAKAGLLKQHHWLKNLIAGVIVGVVALPLGMAFAIASGAKPEQGIYTSIVAGLCVSVFGGSRVQIAGPTGAFIVVLSAITSKYGIEGLQLSTMMAGGILVLFGLARMGGVIKFIPAPVIVGFTSGIAVTIWFGQWPDFFGLPAVSGDYFHQKFIQLVQLLPQADPATTGLAITSLLVVLYSPRVPGLKKVPGPLVALLLATLLQYFFQFEQIRTIGSAFDGIPQGLPEFSLPQITPDKLIPLIGPAFTIAMLGSIESLLSAVVADGMSGQRHNSNQELIGQGIANLLTPLFGGFAATGAIARTATNIRNGGNSPLAGIVHSITLVVILILLAPLAIHIPLASLSAILFVVAWNMSEAKHFVKMIKRAPFADVVILVITFSLTVFTDLVLAVNIGVLLSTLHFLRRMSDSVEVNQSAGQTIPQQNPSLKECEIADDVVVFSLEGPFFFAAADAFEHALQNTATLPRVLIIDLKRVPFMDITGLQSLEEVIYNLQQQGVEVKLAEENARVARKLNRAGLNDLIREENRFAHIGEAVRSC
ncbi:SulP family inorganic anion transporter [Vibrio sp. SCSIO 43137]|uniref:SulP family inorganic anion transporter n=1 Tax=Vibrio sp. SCSIO 43137 TaxID=3021011 RepID=UPI0023070E97|nr:SulP family inorganic anion transporter [Vibrio sp. SCSIO 43137]WCE29151.1 SulP family inorganic anion transporter [Vibrio sp. SCSIO 43137]